MVSVLRRDSWPPRAAAECLLAQLSSVPHAERDHAAAANGPPGARPYFNQSIRCIPHSAAHQHWQRHLRSAGGRRGHEEVHGPSVHPASAGT